ncbi:urate hydroxylase PuuD [Pendulispora rubella]|uniref:urate hydroxylase PuuD n=1 Tax=Pendulispora rubella TaxID=2741070 RepID=UPI00374E1706
MDSNLRELFDLLIRWVHLIAGIMWIGNSMLWNWLDRNLVPRADAPEGFEGEIWLVHSGGFYQMEKKQLAPNQMPKVLHWFKWQAYTTWMSGFALLLLVYYMGDASFLVDPAVAKLSHGAAMGIGLGSLAGGFLVYDLIWRSPLRTKEPIAIGLCFTLLAGIIYGLNHLLSGRAAFIHVGALLGTIMVGNVFFHIMPSQHELIALTKAGKRQDAKLGKHAKQRSIHNNYMTFPVLFIMLSNHFPSTYGNSLNWVLLAVLMVSGALVRHFMNIRFWWPHWGIALGATVVIGVGTTFALMTRTSGPPVAQAATDTGEKVDFSAVRIVIGQRCVPCHSATTTDDQWKVAPSNVTFDTPEQIKMYAERIKARAVINKTMPFGNKTGMTQEERDLLARWFLQGSPVQ